MWLNEYDVEESVRRASTLGMPVAEKAAQTLRNLMEWTNENSDGWPYWQAPSNAASKLQEALHVRFFSAYDKREHMDILPGAYVKMLTPIKAFLTRRNVPHEYIIVK